MFRIVIALWLACVAVTATAAEKRVALVIGNGSYASVPRLDNAGRDAAAVAKALRDAGFDSVQVERDLGRDAMLAALRKFEAQVDQADWALVYFAGHGMEVGGSNYLIPIDARLRSDRDVEDEAISLGQVQKRIESARKLRLVILDACRENPFAVQMQKTLASRSVGRGLARPDLPQTGSLVAFAAGTGQIALDGDARANSPYATALIKNLAVSDVEVNLFFRRVRADVLSATDQKQEPATYESLPAERYVFRPAPVVAPTVSVVPPANLNSPLAAPIVPPTDGALLDMIRGVTDRVLLSRLSESPLASVREAAVARLATLAPEKPAKPVEVARPAQIAALPPPSLMTAPEDRPATRSFIAGYASVEFIVFSKDGKTLFSDSPDLWTSSSGNHYRAPAKWDISGRQLFLLGNEYQDFTHAAALSSDGTRLVTGNSDKKVRIWDAEQGKLIRSIPGATDDVRAVAFSLDGTKVIAGSDDRAIHIWDAAKGTLIRRINGHSGSVNAISVFPSGRAFASASSDRSVRIWDAQSGASARSLVHSSGVLAVAVSPDGSLLASGTDGGSLTIWDAKSWIRIRDLDGNKASVNSVAFSPDGSKLAAGGNDGILRLWDVTSGAVLAQSEKGGYIASVAFAPDGASVAYGGADKLVTIWPVGSKLRAAQ